MREKVANWKQETHAAASGPATGNPLAHGNTTSVDGRWCGLFDRSLDGDERGFQRQPGLVRDNLPKHGPLRTSTPILLRAFESEQVIAEPLAPRAAADADRDVER